MIVYISSVEQSLIKIDNNNVIESSQEKQKIKVKCAEDFLLSVFPFETEIYLPLFCKIKLNAGQITCSNENVTILCHASSIYEIIVKLPHLNSSTLIHKEKIKLNTNVLVLVYNNKLILEKDSTSFSFDLNFVATNPVLITKKDCLIMICEKEDRVNLIVVYDKLSKCDQFSATTIGIDEKHITLAKKNNDIAKTVSVTKLIFEEDYKKETHIAYKHKTPKLVFLPKLVPYAFMQAVKQKDFALARMYLTETFKNKLDDEHILQYFGDFVSVIVPRIKTPPYTVALVYQDKQLSVKHYTFCFDDNKIVNISEFVC